MSTRILLLGLILIAGSVLAEDRILPASWSLDREAGEDLAGIDRSVFGALDLDALATEDADREAQGQPPRFAYPHQTFIRPDQRGTWDRHGDTDIWRFRVQAEQAVLINFGFSDFHLPEGARLYVYHPKAALEQSMARHLVIGPYDVSRNRPHGEFWTPNLDGDDAIVEVNVPASARDQFSLTISQVSQGYRGFGRAALGYRQTIERGGEGKQACEDERGVRSGACNQDVACLSEGDPWNDPVRSVGAYQRSGVFACTGSLVNNTASDQRMLFMTATHCINQAQSPSIVVYWQYEWPTCRRPGASGGTDTNPPDPNLSQSGGTWLAATSNPFGGNCTGSDECSDVTLIELDDPADEAFELHWSGWDRRAPPTACAQGPGNATEGLCATIHHPGVDEKRITWVADDIQVGSIAGASNIHWHPFWHPEPPELPNMPPPPPTTIPPAVTEPGSSGSPLYTAERRFIGVLSGGPAFCGATGSQLSDFYGGLWNAWEGMGTPTTRMRDHLDPVGTNPEYIDGTDGDGFVLQPESLVFSQCGFDDLDIGIDVAQSGTFDDPVTLTTDGLPAGVVSEFSVNPVTPPDSTTLTLSALNNAGTGEFVFTVEGSGGDQDRFVDLSVTLNDAAPGDLVITSPGDGDLGVSATPLIEWTAADQGFAYELEIALDPGFADIVYSTTTSSTSHQVTSALDTNTSYHVRVRAGNDCGTADWSPVIGFTTEALPGDCPVGTQVQNLLLEDFDGGELPAGWSTAGSSGTVTWVPSTAQSHSGSHSVFAQNVATVTDQRLATPAVSLPSNAVSLFLNFQNWQHIESSSTGCFDGGLLEISTDGGNSWTQVSASHILVRDYDGGISTSWGNPLGGLQAWCGDPRDFWERYSVDLSDWAGENVSFRFRFGTDSSVSRVGWYVDSVNVRACTEGEISEYTIGGTVSGLEGSGLVLQNNGGDDLAISADGSFEFDTPIADGDSYEVTVFAQPENPLQTCTVDNGSGQVDGADVTDVAVTCVTETFTIGGTVSGLQGSGLVLGNGEDTLSIADNGPFTFPTELAQGESYDVHVVSQPDDPLEYCTVANGTGTMGTSDIDDVTVECEVRPVGIFDDRFEATD